MCNFKKGKTLLQAEAIEILKSGCDIVVPIDRIQAHIEFYYLSENLLVIHNTLYGPSCIEIYSIYLIKSTFVV